jgi:hypothetical protein
MTIASAFNDIAAAQGGTASKNGTISGAIDALNDALAGSDQQQASTIEGAVRLLGEHIGGGGGGSFGPLQYVVESVTQPSVGDDSGDAVPVIYEISSGNTVFARSSNGIMPCVAAGLTVVSFSHDTESTICDAYVCNVGEEYLYTSVTPWDGTVIVGSLELFGETVLTYTLTAPELNFDPATMTGEYLVLYVHSA